MVTKKEKIHKNVQQGISSSGKENHHHINTVLSPSQPEIVEQSRSCDPVTSHSINSLIYIPQNLWRSDYNKQKILRDGWKL